LPSWVAEALLIMLPVNLDARSDLLREARDRYELVVQSRNRATLCVDLANNDLLATGIGHEEVDMEALRPSANRTGISS
jgi:hypothetical protein